MHLSFAGISTRHRRETRQNRHSNAPEFRRNLESTPPGDQPESRLERTGVSLTSRLDITERLARITAQNHRSSAGISIRHHRETRQNPRLNTARKPARTHTRRHRSFPGISVRHHRETRRSDRARPLQWLPAAPFSREGRPNNGLQRIGTGLLCRMATAATPPPPCGKPAPTAEPGRWAGKRTPHLPTKMPSPRPRARRD